MHRRDGVDDALGVLKRRAHEVVAGGYRAEVFEQQHEGVAVVIDGRVVAGGDAHRHAAGEFAVEAHLALGEAQQATAPRVSSMALGSLAMIEAGAPGASPS